jgi:hypothetical protein
MRMAARAFDPQSPGARRLAMGWLATRYRWTIRLTEGIYASSDGMHEVGDEIELPRTLARGLVEGGVAELVSTRIASPRED